MTEMFNRIVVNRMLDNAITSIIDPDKDLTLLAGAIFATEDDITKVAECVCNCLPGEYSAGLERHDGAPDLETGQPIPHIDLTIVKWVGGAPFYYAGRSFIVTRVKAVVA